MPAAERGRGLGDEIGLARRESATLGSRHLGLARALVDELPCALAHLSAGTVSEWGATVLAKETAVLDPDDRRRVDAELADRLASMTPRQIERAARAMAVAIDSRAMARRRARATADRRVSIRPQPDTMAVVTGLLPVEQGVAAWAALRRDAEAAKAAGDERGIGQLMADLFVERLTGQAAADAVPVEVQLVMSPGTLLGVDDAPASLLGHGPLPAGLARDLVLGVDGAGDDTAGDDAPVMARPRVAPGCGASSPTRWVASSPRIRAGVPSLHRCGGCCVCATGCAGSPSATRRSGTTTTWCP